MKELTEQDRAIHEWQMWVGGFDADGQRKLKNATVLISRAGGVGGALAFQLVAAGVGRLILAHAGDLRPSDLNRQVLMRHDALGTSRVDCAAQRLREFKPDVEIVAVPENISESNAANLISQADVIADCAPLFAERFLMNREAVRQRKPMVECAMYELELHVTTIVPGQTPCLACLYPEPPPHWKREFPVFGAVAATAGSLGAMEVIKLLSGLGETLAGKLLTADLRNMTFRRVNIQRRLDCAVCGGAQP
ncbi:MAG TPA: HesA/MoeB/ThiF family protein [Candidatus Acidoferrum sp.]|nr:HesA/MoeB/ThiF family protein [Candidatus Acidoferrum sp.]